MDTTQVIHEKDKSRFALYDGESEIGYLSYTKRGDQLLSADHTIVHPEYEGQGFAGHLLDALVEYARENQMKIIPLCAYVKKRFDQDPEVFQDVRATLA